MSLDDFRKITEAQGWRIRAGALLEGQLPSDEDKAAFCTHWVVAGHHIREQIADDRLLVRLLRRLLPPYVGGALTLFRGENLKRWGDHYVGFAWTDCIEVARMFGRGLNSHASGGVLLRGTFDPAAIISGTNNHSAYLGEGQFTIDPFVESSIVVVEQFPPCFQA